MLGTAGADLRFSWKNTVELSQRLLLTCSRGQSAQGQRRLLGEGEISLIIVAFKALHYVSVIREQFSSYLSYSFSYFICI